MEGSGGGGGGKGLLLLLKFKLLRVNVNTPSSSLSCPLHSAQATVKPNTAARTSRRPTAATARGRTIGSEPLSWAPLTPGPREGEEDEEAVVWASSGTGGGIDATVGVGTCELIGRCIVGTWLLV